MTIFSFFTLAAVLTLNSCTQDPCVELNCENGGSCSDGLCQCPTGFEGAQCDITTASRFVGSYSGTMNCDNTVPNAEIVDISLIEDPDKISVKMNLGDASLSFEGVAGSSELNFERDDEAFNIHGYATIDGDVLYLYIEMLNKTSNDGRVCNFSGTRIVEK